MIKELNVEGLGNLVYEENFWTGKRTVKLNGVTLEKRNKTTFAGEVEGESVVANLYGNWFTGLDIECGEHKVNVIPKTLPMEYFFFIVIFMLDIIWGNSIELCKIVPVVGGAIGGAISGFGGVLTLIYSKQTNDKSNKLMIGISGIIATFLACALVGYIIVSSYK